MGEAKRRAARAAAQAAAGPAAVFVQMGIDTTAPGFYDHAAFQARERSDPVFLEQYARFVRDQAYTPQYLERSRRLIPRIAAILQEEMALAGRHRACMDGGLSLSKMLEQAGIWNTVVRGAFSAEVVGSDAARGRRRRSQCDPIPGRDDGRVEGLERARTAAAPYPPEGGAGSEAV